MNNRSITIYVFVFYISVFQVTLLFPSVLWHCWLGDRKSIRPVKKLDVGLLVTFRLEFCTSYSSSCHHVPPSSKLVSSGGPYARPLQPRCLNLSPTQPSVRAPIKSRMETLWYRLTQVHLEKWLLKRRRWEWDNVCRNGIWDWWVYLLDTKYLDNLYRMSCVSVCPVWLLTLFDVQIWHNNTPWGWEGFAHRLQLSTLLW